jgi:hypothetical protein
MPDLDAFEAEVKAKIKQLSSKEAATRRKAAAWLGEAGDPTAITSLAQVYKNDADPGVKEAAAYSLGMFRKLEQELDGDNSQAAVALLEKVALEGKMGGRLRFPRRALVKLELALLLSALMVAALAFVLPGVLTGGGFTFSFGTGDNGDQATQVANGAGDVPDKDRATILRELRGALGQVNNNATKLQGQYQLVLGGGKLPCNEFFDTLTPYALSANNAQEFPDLAPLATDIAQAQTDYTAAKATYDRVCVSGESLSAGDFGGPMGTTITLIQRLPTIETALVAAESQTVTAPEVQADVTPTAEPTAVGGGIDIRPHLTALQNIIDEVTAPRGAYTMLNQYWTEASGSGTQGCNDPFNVAEIPADYVLPSELMVAAPTLRVSADLVNTGLRALRDGWQTFGLACSANTLGQFTADGLARMGAAKQAFDTAAIQIAGLRNGL